MSKLPKVIEVNDYHEFKMAQYHINLVDPTVKVKEVGFAGEYMGIIYRGRLTDPENAKLVTEIKAQVKEYEEYETVS